MDLDRVILWSSVAFAGSGMTGYVLGFWEARPNINALAIAGAVAVVVAAITMAVVLRAFLRSRSLHVSLNRLAVAPRIGLLWSTAAIVAGINLGVFLGFTIGLRTAQSVADILSGVGVAVMLVATVTVLAGITYKGRSHYKRNRRR